jgi:hypothetical protein
MFCAIRQQLGILCGMSLAAAAAAALPAGDAEDVAGRALVGALQRALIPMVHFSTADYNLQLQTAFGPQRGRPLTGIDMAAWMIPEHERVWTLAEGAAEHLPNPLWAWVRAGIASANEETLDYAFDVLMRTGCNRPEIVNSCDGDGWSLLMNARLCGRAYHRLHTEPAVDWSYAPPGCIYSMLSEAIAAGDDYGVYALTRLGDAEVTRIVSVPSSAVMHRVVCDAGGFRRRTLQALRRREGVVWPTVFARDSDGGTLPARAMHATSSGPYGIGTEENIAAWDTFADPLAPWHAAFIDACNHVMPFKPWDQIDPLRAASTHVPVSSCVCLVDCCGWQSSARWRGAGSGWRD